MEGMRNLVRSVAEEVVKGVISACDLCRAVLSLKGVKCPETVGEPLIGRG